MSEQNQDSVSSPNTQKRAPPPVPSRERRTTLGQSDSASSLPIPSSKKTDTEDSTNDNHDAENNNSATIDESNDPNEEGTDEFVEPEYNVEEIPPIELVNGEPLVDQWVLSSNN